MTVSKPLNIVVLVSGVGSNLRNLVEHTTKTQTHVHYSGVVSDNPGAGGLAIAQSFGIPTAVIERKEKQSRADFCKALLSVVAVMQPDIIVLAGFMRVLSSEFIVAFRDRIINLHPSLLPAFPGLRAQEQALQAGVRIAGCTVHLVDEEVDAGPILAQAAVPVLPTDSVETLTSRIRNAEHMLLPAVVTAIARGDIRLTRIASELTIETAPGFKSFLFLESVEGS